MQDLDPPSAYLFDSTAVFLCLCSLRRGRSAARLKVSCSSWFMMATLRLFLVPLQNVTAATAAAQAAAALGQLAAALAGQAPMEPTAIVAVPVTGLPLALNIVLCCLFSRELAPALLAPVLAGTMRPSSSSSHVCMPASSPIQGVGLQPPISWQWMCPAWPC